MLIRTTEYAYQKKTFIFNYLSSVQIIGFQVKTFHCVFYYFIIPAVHYIYYIPNLLKVNSLVLIICFNF